MKSLKVLFFALLAIPYLSSQSSLESLANDILFHSDVVANALRPESKNIAQVSLLETVENFLATPGSFNYEFKEDVWVSIKSPSNMSFKIYTWELRKGEFDYEYFGYVQLPDGSFIKLNDESDEMDDIEYMDLDKDFWYGALYYNMVEAVDAEGKPYAVLFGINKKNQYTTTKVGEVISIVNGEVVLGKPVFKGEESGDLKSRIYLSYSSDANVTLNYNQGTSLILFDNLIARMGMMQGQGPTQFPDGSYRGFKLENGSWAYVDKVYDQISATAPNVKPSVPRNKKKDIFGRKN